MKKLMSLILALVLLASCVTVLAEEESTEFVCPEMNIATRIPAGAVARYEEGTGLVIYTRSEGYIPYVVVSRRSQEMKFKNPVDYLNNVVREHMENKYGDKYQGMNSATVWEVDGKTVLGARYMFLIGDAPVPLFWVLEIRDGGDVEYTAKYTDETADITLTALNLAVRNYRETDTEEPVVPETTGTETVSEPDDDEWSDYHCEEDGFTTKKPYHALTQYKDDRGYVGITFYLDVPGYPQYVMIHRRPMEAKFKNPKNYLNNTYREFLEDKFANSRVTTNLAKTWEVGGKQLTGAKYTISDEYGDMVQLQLIEVRELGDVEYTVMYNGPEEEALVMKALDAAVANYAEDEAKDTSAATTETASAEVLSGSLPGLAEIREKIESGSKFSVVIRRNSNGAVIFSLDRYLDEDIHNLWDAANDSTIGEPVEVPAEAPRTYIEFWLASQDFVRLNFAGDYYEAPDGTCYRLENDGRFRELVNAMTDQELAMIRLDYRPVILGKTTPAELVNFGWDLSFEEDGTIVLSQDGRDGMIFVTTEHASMNRPIMKVNAMWAEDLDIEYFGFDGYVSPYLAEGEDNDQRWNKEYSYEVLINSWENDDIYIDRWGALCNWLVDECGAKVSEEGIYEAEVVLSNGQTLYISSHDTAPCISLIGD